MAPVAVDAAWSRPYFAATALSTASNPPRPLRVPHPLQARDLVDLWRLQVVPEDAARSVVHPLHLDPGARGRDQVDGEIMVGDHEVLANDLDRVDGGGDAGPLPDLVGLDEQPVFEVGEPAALADPRPAQVDRHRAAQDEVDPRDLLKCD